MCKSRFTGKITYYIHLGICANVLNYLYFSLQIKIYCHNDLSYSFRHLCKCAKSFVFQFGTPVTGTPFPLYPSLSLFSAKHLCPRRRMDGGGGSVPVAMATTAAAAATRGETTSFSSISFSFSSSSPRRPAAAEEYESYFPRDGSRLTHLLPPR